MKKTILLAFTASLLTAYANVSMAKFYGETLCKEDGYKCVKVKRGDTWQSLFPEPEQRDIVKRVNRMNRGIYPGLTLAVPANLENVTVYDVSPFPRYIEATGEKTIYVDQQKLAWGAYDGDGELVWWGPISSGKDFCPDIGKSCSTPSGAYKVASKQGIDCISSKFPVETDGGAPMPYCMHFFGGYALHGSYDVPGYRDSHGCVRLFIEDARWLNREFVDTSVEGGQATRVIVDGFKL